MNYEQAMKIISYASDLNNVKWNEILKSHILSESEIVNYFDNILARHKDSRWSLIMDVFKKKDEKIGKELFFKFLNVKLPNNVSSPYAFWEHVKQPLDICELKPEQLTENVKENIASFVNFAMPGSLKVYEFMKKNSFDFMFKPNVYMNNIKQYGQNMEMKEVLQEMYSDYKNKAVSLNYSNLIEIFGFKDLLEKVQAYGLYETVSFINSRYYNDCIENEIVFDTLEKIKENKDFYEKNPTLVKEFVKNIKNRISEEEYYELVMFFTPLNEKVRSNKVDWNEMDEKIENMNYQMRWYLFARTDIPVWFLKKHHAILIHIQLQETINLNDRMDQRNMSSHPYFEGGCNKRNVW